MDIIKFETPDNTLERTYYVAPFPKELKSLYGKSKIQYQEYERYLLECLITLERSNTRLNEEPFEHLSIDNYDIYRIKSKSKKKNTRVLYIYVPDDEQDNIVLLCAFQEQNNSDYKNNIAKAKKRIKEIGG